MMPSTGPKYSVLWNLLPALTPVLTPGDHSRPVSSNCRGSRIQLSPRPSSVSPERSFPPGASITGPIMASGSSGYPTLRVVTASTSCLRKRSDLATDPTRMRMLAAEHFCPACPKALFTASATARSKSALGVTIKAFLPLVSANNGNSARQDRNNRAVSNAPVRISRSTPGCEIRP